MTQKTTVLLRLVSVVSLAMIIMPVVNSRPLGSGSQAAPSAERLQTGSLLIRMVRTGGYTGTEERFDIYLDGHVTNAAGQTQRVPPQAVQEIQHRVEKLDLPNSCEVRVTGSPCTDCFAYRIVLIGSSGMKRTLVLEDPMTGSDSISRIARDIRGILSSLKWK